MDREVDLARAVSCLEAAVGSRILVVGDFMLDHYVIGDVSRISPEAPVPVVAVRREYWLPGGAGNVARNLSAFGLTPVCSGVIGDDANGRLLRDRLAAAGAETEGLAMQSGTPTTCKTRVLARSQHVIRIDREDGGQPSTAAADRLSAYVPEALANCSAVLFSDYAKGVLTSGLVSGATQAALADGKPVIADPKPRNMRLFTGATLICPNASEAAQASGIPCDTDGGVETAAAALLAQLRLGAVLVTRGEKGMYILSDRGTHLPALATEVYDVTGAGDTVTALVAVVLVGGGSPLESAALANVAASRVVQHQGCAVVTRDELLQVAQ